MESVPCVICGRPLRSPESMALGYGKRCGLKAPEVRLHVLRGEPGTTLLFPELDKPMIEQTEKEIHANRITDPIDDIKY